MPTSIAASQQAQQPQSFRPLEYWKPPKAVKHIRKKSSALLAATGITKSPGPDRHSFIASKLEDGIAEDLEHDKKDMSFATIRDMAGRAKNGANSHIQMTDGYGRSMGPPPEYKLDRDDTLNHPWYDFKYWGKRGWLTLVAVIVAIIVIIIVVAVVETKANKYPDYTALSYSLSETCTLLGQLPS
jgi:hypothetical protein